MPERPAFQPPRAISNFVAMAATTSILALMVFFCVGKATAADAPPFSDANWVSMGAMPGADSTVNAILRDPNSGTLYIGGAFNVIGTAIAGGVAKWDGTNWSSLGSGLGGSVRALALDSTGNLYAGGAFTNAPLQATNIAKWNGTSWSPLGNGVTRQVLSLPWIAPAQFMPVEHSRTPALARPIWFDGMAARGPAPDWK